MNDDFADEVLASFGAFAILALLAVAVIHILTSVTVFVVANTIPAVMLAVVGGLVGVLVYSSTFRRAYIWTSVVVGHIALIGYSSFEYATCDASPTCWLPDLALIVPTGVLATLVVLTLAYLGARQVRAGGRR